MYLIGVIIVLLAIILGFILKGISLAMFFNPTAVGIVLLSIIGIIVATSGFKTFIRGLNAVISSEYVIDDDERNKAADLYRLLSKAVILASIAGFLIGLIATFTNLSDTEIVAHALTAAMITPVIGIFLAIAFFEPAAYILKKPRETPSVVKEYSKHLGDHLLEMCSRNGLTQEEIQNATGIELRRD